MISLSEILPENKSETNKIDPLGSQTTRAFNVLDDL